MHVRNFVWTELERALCTDRCIAGTFGEKTSKSNIGGSSHSRYMQILDVDRYNRHLFIGGR